LICLAATGIIPIFVPVIMIARDVVVDAGRMHASSRGVVVSAIIYGKLKTIAQMFAIIVLFFIFNSAVQNAQ
jgi:CDP-diacylglycerol--glycerol-3-phosphate 3-phosphatidyltransferase